MNMSIISVSRRTDIPAYYGEWFMNRLKEGFVEYRNPFNYKSYSVSLLEGDVSAFVFWSKNFEPFLESLYEIEKNYNFYIQYTITALKNDLELYAPDIKKAIDTFKILSDRYFPQQVIWRFDPIIITNQHSIDYYVESFDYISSELKGYTKRCHFSFVQSYYKKVQKQFKELTDRKNIVFNDDFQKEKELLEKLSGIAESKSIQLYTCCQDQYISNKILKGSCIDRDLLRYIFPNKNFNIKKSPTRKQCGCFKSIDIGKYDSCPQGCLYCYATKNHLKAKEYLNKHDIYSKEL